MQPIRNLLFLLVIACMHLVCGVDEAPKPKLPPDAQRAVDAYEASVAKLKADFDAKVAKERGALMVKLEAETAKLTKAGNLDGALACRTYATTITPASQGPEFLNGEPIEQAALGTWKTEAGYRITLTKGGSAVWADATHSLNGGWSVEKGGGNRALRITWQNGVVYRIVSANVNAITGSELNADGSEARSIRGARDEQKTR